jgi:hypothetical protein
MLEFNGGTYEDGKQQRYLGLTNKSDNKHS